MAFFPRTIYNTEASITPLFRLFDDFDKISRQGGNSCPAVRRPATVSRWQPRFDVRETQGAYELHGELPGMTRDNLSIEFPEHQTMIVRGKTERSYTAGTPSADAQVEDSTSAPASVTEGSERRHSHQATVEDDDESETKSDWEEVSVDKKQSSPAIEQEKPQQQQEQKPATAADKAKYWLSERSIGEFSRTFHFPSRVDEGAVTANLKDGVLSVVVPKAKKHEPRRVAVN